MDADAMLFGERRQYIRKECLRLIDIHDGSKLYPAHLRDLALGGAFVECNEVNRFPIGRELFLSIPFGLRTSFVRVHAKVARIQHKGIGVWFLKTKLKHSAYP
jgi:Tfp pilus assembly protein PilZ